MEQLTTSDIERIIKKNMMEMGLTLADDKINQIKNNVKLMANSAAKNSSTDQNITEEDINPNDVESNVIDVRSAPEPETITHSTSADPKELELSQREKELDDREAELNRKIADIEAKESENKYIPEVPSVLSNVEPEDLFLFDENDLNLGGESLKDKKFYHLNNPEDKSSMHDLWLEKGVTKAKLFKVKFEEIGELQFAPYDGVAKFDNKRTFVDINSAHQMEPQNAYDSISKALNSQIPTEPMIDAIEPITNVTLPMGSDMGLNTVKTDDIIKSKIDDILRAYLQQQGKL
jgi:hypothetical protein